VHIARRFTVGWVIITPSALGVLLESQEDPKSFVHRHTRGDWGAIGPEKWAENEYAVIHGEPLFSVYHTRHDRKLFVATGGNRFATAIFLPEDYANLHERSR
jgi:hypothetical protein